MGSVAPLVLIPGIRDQQGGERQRLPRDHEHGHRGTLLLPLCSESLPQRDERPEPQKQLPPPQWQPLASPALLSSSLSFLIFFFPSRLQAPPRAKALSFLFISPLPVPSFPHRLLLLLPLVSALLSLASRRHEHLRRRRGHHPRVALPAPPRRRPGPGTRRRHRP